MTTNDPTLSDDVHDAAAHWFTREHGGLMTSAERGEFAAWRQADPRHEAAYQGMLRVWGVAQATPDAVFERLVQRRAPVRASRRRVMALGVGAAACAAVAAVALTGPDRWLHAPDFVADYTSGRGERRSIELPDGSVVTLNTDSIARVQFYAAERRVALVQGEAFFAVAPAADRPFVVDTDLATVTVTGTQFNVRRDPDQVAVTVASGSVDVASGRWWRRTVRRVTAAQAVQVGRDTPLVATQAVDVAAVTAWRQGKVVFDAAPLDTIVSEMNRYRAQPVRLQSAALRGLRVSGVFSTEDPEAFLTVLPSLAPVVVLRLPDGRRELVPR